MLRGSKKLRLVGIIEIASTSFMLIFFIIVFIMLGIENSRLNELYSDHNADHSRTFSFSAKIWLTIFVILGYHIYRLVVAIFAVRRSDKAESAGAIMGNSILLFIMSVLWLIYMFEFVMETANAQSIALFICAVTDVAMLIQMMIGSFRNMHSDPQSGTLSVNPYGDNVPTQQQDNSTEQ